MKKINWDNTFSSFYWEMRYKQGHESGWGYSKADGHPEAADKVRTLCRCLKMLFTGGYITDKCHRIDLYQKQGAIIRKDQDIAIITLYPDRYEFIPSYVVNDVKTYLDEVYNAITTGEVPEGKLMPPRKIKNRSLDEIFRTCKQTTYASYDMFFKARQYLKSIGVTVGQLQTFETEVRSRQGYLFTYNAAAQVHDFLLGGPKERKLVSAKEFYGANKSELIEAGERVKEKYDVTNLPTGVSLGDLIKQELQNASKKL